MNTLNPFQSFDLLEIVEIEIILDVSHSNFINLQRLQADIWHMAASYVTNDIKKLCIVR